MDETDLFGIGKSKSKKDKADASGYSTSYSREASEYPSNIPSLPIISRPAREEYYRTDHPNVGIAIVLNHKEIKNQKQRAGTEKDRDNITASLKQYGFDVRVYNDLTFGGVTEVLKSTAAEDHSNNDCFLLVVMSHGSEGKVFAKDMSYPVERLWNPFLGDACRTLINKPKLFFIQACRGEELERPVVFSDFAPMSRNLSGPGAQSEPTQQVVNYAIPSTADLLVFYSTFERHFAFRNVEDGSWFIQSVCSVLNEVASYNDPDGWDLLRLLTAINRKVAYEYQSSTKVEEYNNKKEMPNFLSTLTKIFLLKVKRIDPETKN